MSASSFSKVATSFDLLVQEMPFHSFPGQIFKMLLRGLSRRHRFVGILVLELVQ